MLCRNHSCLAGDVMKLTSQEIYTRFRQRALRVTRQRAAIYAALTGTASHPTADELYRTVRRQYPMMSLNTIYYTLGVLRQAGLVREVNVGHDVARFDGNKLELDNRQTERTLVA